MSVIWHHHGAVKWVNLFAWMNSQQQFSSLKPDLQINHQQDCMWIYLRLCVTSVLSPFVRRSWTLILRHIIFCVKGFDKSLEFEDWTQNLASRHDLTLISNILARPRRINQIQPLSSIISFLPERLHAWLRNFIISIFLSQRPIINPLAASAVINSTSPARLSNSKRDLQSESY